MDDRIQTLRNEAILVRLVSREHIVEPPFRLENKSDRLSHAEIHFVSILNSMCEAKEEKKTRSIEGGNSPWLLIRRQRDDVNDSRRSREKVSSRDVRQCHQIGDLSLSLFCLRVDRR